MVKFIESTHIPHTHGGQCKGTKNIVNPHAHTADSVGQWRPTLRYEVAYEHTERAMSNIMLQWNLQQLERQSKSCASIMCECACVQNKMTTTEPIVGDTLILALSALHWIQLWQNFTSMCVVYSGCKKHFNKTHVIIMFWLNKTHVQCVDNLHRRTHAHTQMIPK